ncbi:MAG: transposase [Synechococcus sp.]
MLNLVKRLDESKCYEAVRQLRWLAGVRCSRCSGERVFKRGTDELDADRQHYQ